MAGGLHPDDKIGKPVACTCVLHRFTEELESPAGVVDRRIPGNDPSLLVHEAHGVGFASDVHADYQCPGSNLFEFFYLSGILFCVHDD